MPDATRSRSQARSRALLRAAGPTRELGGARRTASHAQAPIGDRARLSSRSQCSRSGQIPSHERGRALHSLCAERMQVNLLRAASTLFDIPVPRCHARASGRGGQRASARAAPRLRRPRCAALSLALERNLGQHAARPPYLARRRRRPLVLVAHPQPAKTQLRPRSDLALLHRSSPTFALDMRCTAGRLFAAALAAVALSSVGASPLQGESSLPLSLPRSQSSS